jgi:hypothetical protein
MIFLPGTPLSKTTVEAECRIDFTIAIHLGPKPLAISIEIMALYSTLSNAFSKSIFNIIMGFLEVWQIWRYSNVHPKQT